MQRESLQTEQFFQIKFLLAKHSPEGPADASHLMHWKAEV